MIDVHHHVIPAHLQGTHQFPQWSISEDLEAMERMGISGALLSIPASMDSDSVRGLNGWLAELTSYQPKVYGMLASLSPHETDSALKEIAYCMDILKADGFILLSSYKGKYIGDEMFDPLFEELNSRNAVVMLHPTSPHDSLKQYITDPSIYEFPLETTRAVADLLFRKRFSTYPNIRWIISHAGGTIPFLCHRFSIASEWNDMVLSSQEVHSGLGSLYYDLALSVSEISLAALLQVAGQHKILFGTDFPLRFENGVTESINAFKGTKLLTNDQKFDISTSNAKKLFRRFE